VIAGATRGTGGRALAKHLVNRVANESNEPGPSRGLVSDPSDAYAQQRELEALQSHARTARPIHHVHLDPPPGLSLQTEAAARSLFWQEYEREFGLEQAPFYSRIHVKSGRTHEHRVYGLGRADGSVVGLSFEFARREKVSRAVEVGMGLPLTAGAHNRAVIGALERDGRPEIAEAMRAAGLHEGPRPRAPTTPAQRAQSERTGIDPRTLGAAVLAAWRSSNDGAAFRSALADQGLVLAQGTKAAIVVDGAGGTHPLARMLGKESKAAEGDRIAAADVSARLAGLDLPRHVPGADPVQVPAVAPAVVEGVPLSVRPLDASRPGDWLRVLNEATEAMNRQAAAARVPAKKGRPEDDAIKIGIETGRSIRAAFDDAFQRAADAREERVAAAAASAGMDDRGPARDHGDGREGLALDAPGDGPPGAVPDRVRGVSGGTDVEPSPAPPGPPGAEGGGEQDRDPGRGGGGPAGRPEGDSRGPEGDSRRPSRTQVDAGRDRAEAGRVEIALAGHATALDRIQQKVADFRDPAAAAARQRAAEQVALRAQVTASRARVAAVLSTSPFPDPADRSRSRLQAAACDRVTAAKGASEARAAAAAARATELRERVGIVSRMLAIVGLKTPAVQAAREADREAERAERAAKDVRLDYRDDLVHADRSGAAEADRRQRQQDQWEDRPDVRAARREETGNRMVAVALRSGDPEIREAIRQEDGLRIAREMLHRREVERLAEVQRQNRHDPGPLFTSAPLAR